MKTLLIAAAIALVSPSMALAQAAAPACPHCEKADKPCCEKDQDGKMRCSMMERETAQQGGAQHDTMDHGAMDHAGHAPPSPQAPN